MVSIVTVLGNRLQSREIHPELRGRMDVGIEAFEETDAEFLLLSGGQANREVPLSECEVMRRYAVENGVAHDEILLEDQSLDTIGNGYFSRRTIDAIDGLAASTIHLVSSCYHLERGKVIFEQCFGEDCTISIDYCYRSDRSADEIYEEDALAQARQFFEPVEPGNVREIRDRLIETHALYDESNVDEVPAAARDVVG